MGVCATSCARKRRCAGWPDEVHGKTNKHSIRRRSQIVLCVLVFNCSVLFLYLSLSLSGLSLKLREGFFEEQQLNGRSHALELTVGRTRGPILANTMFGHNPMLVSICFLHLSTASLSLVLRTYCDALSSGRTRDLKSFPNAVFLLMSLDVCTQSSLFFAQPGIRINSTHE